MKLKWIMMSFLFLGMVGCKTMKMDKSADATNILSMSKGACFGDCPAYSVTVSSDGMMDMFAQKMTKGDKRYGNYSKQMSKSEFSKFATLYSKVDKNSLENMYDKDVMDAPQTTFVFHIDNDKISKYKFSAPKELLKLSEYIHSLVNDSNSWTAKNSDVEQVDVLNKDKRKFIVKLKKEVNLRDWLKKYSFHNMKVEKVLSQNDNIYMLNFKSTMAINHISEELRRDKDVISMELHPAPKKGNGNKHGEIQIRTDRKGNK